MARDASEPDPRTGKMIGCKCTDAYKSWVKALGKHLMMEDTSDVLHMALVMLAAAKGFPAPPPRKDEPPLTPPPRRRKPA